MEVQLYIPDEYSRYFEFIPKDVLPSILLDLIVDGVEKRFAKKTKEDNVELNKETLIELLKSANIGIAPSTHNAYAGNNASIDYSNTYTSTPTTVTEDVVHSEPIVKLVESIDDDDLDDLLDDFLK